MSTMRKLIYAAGTVAILIAATFAILRAQQSAPQASGTVPPSSSGCNGTYTGTYTGNLIISKGQSCIFTAGGVTVNITLTGGTLVVANAAVGGNVQATSGGSFTIGPGTTVSGNVQATNLPGGAQSSICASQVRGDVQATNNKSPIVVGAQQSCPGNAIQRNVQAVNNAATASIDGNTVGGNLQATNNAGVTQIFGNTVTGNLQCENNASIAVGANTAKLTQGQCVATTTWTAPQLTFYLLPGDLGSRAVTFTSSVALSNISFDADPAIAALLVLPTGTIASVPARQSQTIQIQAKIPASSPSSIIYAGAIRIKAGNQIIPGVLPVTITLGPPPDPGDAGKATLAGIDSDGDGVRDDVQRWIALTYPNSARTRAALYQQAKAVQQAVLLSSNRPQAVAAINGEIAADFCLAGLLSDGSAASHITDQVDSVALNTPARMSGYLIASSYMSGTAGVLPSIASRTSLCAFDPGAMPN